MNYKRQLLIEKKNNFCLFEHAQELIVNELTKEIDRLILEELLKKFKYE
jgi:hypothetical protein